MLRKSLGRSAKTKHSFDFQPKRSWESASSDLRNAPHLFTQQPHQGGYKMYY